MADGTIDPDTVARLRRRTDSLTHRHRRALESVVLLASPATKRQLETMRFELAALEWRLAELETAARPG